jgi:CBS domain containing-hemolysin-like protein
VTDLSANDAIIYFVVFLVCVAVSAFFASAEIAFMNLQRFRIKHLQRTGRRGADAVARIMDRPERFLSVVLTSISFSETLLVALGSFLCIYLWGDTIGTYVGIVLIALILLLFVKVIPKTIAAQHPEWLSLHYAPIIEATSTVVSPVVRGLSWITDKIASPTGAHLVPGALMSKQELHTCISISEEEGMMDGTAAQMLKRVVKFGDRSVREMMVPRTQTVWIQEGATLAEFHKVYAESPHMRYPVYEGTFDNVKGVLSSRDVHLAVANGSLNQKGIVTQFLRPVYHVPGSKLVGELFNELRDRKLLMAVVVNEHGGTSGVVTMRQLVEEIVGEIREELPPAESEVHAISEHAYQIEGNMKIPEANELLDLGIPEEADYETVAGFVLDLMGHLPEGGEQVMHNNLRFVVMEVTGSRITKLMITKGAIPPGQGEAPAEATSAETGVVIG